MRQSISEGIGGKINVYKIQKKIVHLGVRGERMWLGKRKCSECNSGQRKGAEKLCVCVCVCVFVCVCLCVCADVTVQSVLV